MQNVVQFPKRYPHPEHSILAKTIEQLIRTKQVSGVMDIARLTGANPYVIDAFLDARVDYYGYVVEAKR
jgi:hypothetical protein